MIFQLHYFLANVGMSTVSVFLALLLKTYSDASLTEVGALLMILPFLGIFTKPFFGALADRQQAHKQYLMGALAVFALGYGSLLIVPLFFADQLQEYGRLFWYCDIVSVVIGALGFGVMWSLGDAIAVNSAHRHGKSWASYRVWAVVSWGLNGTIVGQLNEASFLPKYSVGLIMLLGSIFIEEIFLYCWPDDDFRMHAESKVLGESPTNEQQQQHHHQLENGPANKRQHQMTPLERVKSCDSSKGGQTSARASLRLQEAFTNEIFGKMGESLRLNRRRRAGLDELLVQHKLVDETTSDAATNQQQADAPPMELSPVVSPKSSIRSCATSASRARMGLSGMLSLSAASGFVVLDESKSDVNVVVDLTAAAASSQLQRAAETGSMRGSARSQTAGRRQRMCLSNMNSLGAASGHLILDHKAMMQESSFNQWPASKAGGVAGDGALVRSPSIMSSVSTATVARVMTSKPADKQAGANQSSSASKQDAAEELQLVLLKLIVRRNPQVLSLLVVFTIFGVLFSAHLSFFFVHLERLCASMNSDFANTSSAIFIIHSVSEAFSFTVFAPFIMTRFGKLGSFSACALLYLVRFLYYGTYLHTFSPAYCVPFEAVHGLAYGLVYSCITEYAVECVDLIDEYVPELVSRKIVEPHIDTAVLKLPLRATMQGVFSACFDGLGIGLGALFGGALLDLYSFEVLWLACAALSVFSLVLYPLAQARSALLGQQ